MNWTEEKNNRRCDLIDKKFEGSLSTEEKEELNKLQEEMREYRNKVAPLPIKEARELLKSLLKEKEK